VVASLSVSQITARSVTLSGFADAKGNDTTVRFEYGLDSNYGFSLPASPAALTDSGVVSLQTNLGGLLPGTTYHCRLVATNRAGIARSEDMTFSTNRPPVFTGYAIACGFDKPATVSLKKLLAKAVDPDGDVVVVSTAGPVSLNSGTVSLQPSGILYTPRMGFSGADSFSVSLSDGKGNTTNAMITVDVSPSPNAGGANTNPPTVTMLSNGHVGLEFHGIPGRSYLIQRSIDMANWTRIGTVIAAPNGSIKFTDESPPQPNGFYQLVLP
jgi:hypothetical protein